MITPNSAQDHPGASGLPIALKLVCLTAAIAAAFALSGCNKKNDASSTVKTTTSASSTEPTAEQTAAPADTTTLAETTGTIPEGIPPVGWCNATTLHIRKTPDQNYEAIGGLKYGEKVTIVGREGDWFKIKFKEGVAYVNAQFISPTEIIAPETAAPTAAATTKAQ